MAMLAHLVDAVARSDRDDRARGANKKNLQNYGAMDDEEKKHSVESGEVYDVDEEKHMQYRTWIREERRFN